VSHQAGAPTWRHIDWSRPWFAPYRTWGERAAPLLLQGQPVHEVLQALAPPGWPLQFVPMQALPAGMHYEAFVHQRCSVPTRDNAHDFFNGLVWLRFPALKRWLCERHVQRLNEGAEQAPGHGQIRGQARDAMTLLDENGALVPCGASLRQAWQQRDWAGMFIRHRSHWLHAPPVIVGHALLEKLLQPYKAITAHAWLVPQQQAVDAWLPSWPPGRDWLSLPVLGVPGWWADNECPGYYADAQVFRPLGSIIKA
jgi:hypothetical protein